MTKTELSRLLSRLTGGRDELFCYRVYIQARLYGGLWISLEVTINIVFYLVRREKKHVKRNYIWQRREYARLQNERPPPETPEPGRN